ncbi:MFS transporter [Streptomyces rubiginosohelvolus]|uniref:MFS transporter n=1 Tax=unclassified Streptomyces TaxID=2593676 RepID=UPI00190ADD86|nr:MULTISPECIES: MFS transporter [unclassified Streptomyces]MBK3532812.1 MFS transporter [Streptomyces sp. MBT72]MBK3538841.1 MFS transporter [Streptomyces sp. MBT67]MBK3551481.1 MFS transporter [Streptomyces sp. MBT61]MBK6030087.1 MFS transporter [Streptomyces sp. MBT59]
MTGRPRPGPGRGWLLRLVIAFAFAQGAVSMARPAVSYRALALGADETAVGVIAGVYALLPLFVAVPLGRRTDHGRCAPLLPLGVLLISGGCALSGLVSSLPAMAAWSGVMGLGHLCFVIGAQSIVARQSAPHEQDRNFGHFTIGASLGQLIGPIAAGALISGQGGVLGRTSALALLVSAGVCAVALTSLWRIEHRRTTDARPRTGGKVPVRTILGARGVPAGILISMAVLSATDILTAYLPVVGEHRSIAPATVGLLLSLRAAATIACRLVMTPLLRLLGRRALLTTSCLLAGLLCAGVALPVSVPVLAVMLAVLGFCLGVGQPLSMTTVVRAAPDGARSTALALRLTGNRLGQVAAPAAAGLIAGAVGVAAPFVLLGVGLVGAAGLGLRGDGRTGSAPTGPEPAGEGRTEQAPVGEAVSDRSNRRSAPGECPRDRRADRSPRSGG